MLTFGAIKSINLQMNGPEFVKLKKKLSLLEEVAIFSMHFVLY